MNIKIKQLHPTAIMPRYGSAGAGAFDLYGTHEETVTLHGGWGNHIFSTGLAFEIPPGHCMFVYSRSGHGFKNNTRLSNCVGVIDSDYRGEVLVRLRHDGGEPLHLHPHCAIAQAVILPVPRIEFAWAQTLSETVRGTGGFGSTDPRPIDTAINAKKPL